MCLNLVVSKNFMMMLVIIMAKTFSICFWNVCGLGDDSKCHNELSLLLNISPSIVLPQETKLGELSLSKICSFRPHCMDEYVVVPSTGALEDSFWLGPPPTFDVFLPPPLPTP